MKKLFENWKRYINEGDDWHSEEHETMADRKWADNPESGGGNWAGTENFPLQNVETPSDLDQRATSLWEHLNGLLKQWQPTEDEGIQYKKDLHTLMDDFLKSPDKPSPGGSKEDEREEEYEALPRPTGASHERMKRIARGEDRKAAEEILATRMGSYRGTNLPGGKKIK